MGKQFKKKVNPTTGGLDLYYIETAERAALEGSQIDFANSYVLTKQLLSNTDFSIVNPEVNRDVVIELTADFTWTLPESCTKLKASEDYDPFATNFIVITCIDAVTPKYVYLIHT